MLLACFLNLGPILFVTFSSCLDLSVSFSPRLSESLPLSLSASSVSESRGLFLPGSFSLSQGFCACISISLSNFTLCFRVAFCVSNHHPESLGLSLPLSLPPSFISQSLLGVSVSLSGFSLSVGLGLSSSKSRSVSPYLCVPVCVESAPGSVWLLSLFLCSLSPSLFLPVSRSVCLVSLHRSVCPVTYLGRCLDLQWLPP